MPVSAVGSERHNNIGFDPSQVARDLRDNLPWVRPIQMLVAIIEQGYFAHTQRRGCSAQFTLADFCQCSRTRVLMLVGTETAVAAAATASRGQQEALDSFGCIFRKCAAHS